MNTEDLELQNTIRIPLLPIWFLVTLILLSIKLIFFVWK